MAIGTATTRDEIAAIRSTWESVQSHFNADYEQFVTVCDVRPEVVRPHVVTLANSGRTAFLLGRLENGTFAPTVGYATLVRVRARILHVLHEGLLGDPSGDDAEALIEQIWEALRRGEADVAELHGVREGALLQRAFESRIPTRWRTEAGRLARHWSAAIPTQEGALLARMRSKHRNWHHRKKRELDETFPGRVTWRWLTDFEDIDAICRRLEAVAIDTYQRGLNAGFRDDEEHRRRLALFARRGALRIQLLEIDGAVRAFWLGCRYGTTFHSWATAYDPALRSFEVGNLMFHRMVDELTRERLSTLDFGLGDAFYKQRFGDTSWQERTLRIFAPTPKGALLRTTGQAGRFLDEQARRLVESFGGIDRVKKRWRQRKSEQPQGGA